MKLSDYLTTLIINIQPSWTYSTTFTITLLISKQRQAIMYEQFMWVPKRDFLRKL